MQSESIRLDSMYRDANRIASLNIIPEDHLSSVSTVLVARVGCLEKPCPVGQCLRRICIDPAVCQSSHTDQKPNSWITKLALKLGKVLPRQRQDRYGALLESVLVGRQEPMQSESIRLDSMHRDANRIASLDITPEDCLSLLCTVLVVGDGCLVKPRRVGHSLQRIGIDPAVCRSCTHPRKTQQLDNNARFESWKSVVSPTPRQVQCFGKAFLSVNKHQCKMNP